MVPRKTKHSVHAGSSQHKPHFPQITDYEVLSPIGAGGMGAVYLARHMRLGKQVAIKVLPNARREDAATIARFEREMRAVGKLDHRNLIRALDAREENGLHFLVLEYAKGMDLGRISKLTGPIKSADACELIRQAALGLQYAHENGLIHRDIKPANLLLTEDGVVKILDLGLALLSDESFSQGDGLTASGQIMGTLDYMAPEQADNMHGVDTRADIYSLGCTLFTLLTGHPPFHGSDYATAARKLTAHLTKPLPDLRTEQTSVPPEIAAIVDKMTCKSPEDRYAEPIEVARELAPLVKDHDVTTLLEEAHQRSVTADPIAETDDYRRSSFYPTDEAPAETRADTAEVAFSITPHAKPRVKPRKRKSDRMLLIGLGMFVIGICVAATIIITIRDKDGNVVAEMEVPEGGRFDVRQGKPAEKPKTRSHTPTTKPTITGPANVALQEEPPPLEEWLQGREIITVKQDGTADHQTIQAAIDALKPGQVVEVLDRGPYKINATKFEILADCGIVSRAETIIELLTFAKTNEGKNPYWRGVDIRCQGDFRLHGLAFIPAEKSRGSFRETVHIRPASRKLTVIENALFVSWPEYGSQALNLVSMREDAAARVVVARSAVIGRSRIQPHKLCEFHFRQCLMLGNVFLVSYYNSHVESIVTFRESILRSKSRAAILSHTGGHQLRIGRCTLHSGPMAPLIAVSPSVQSLRLNCDNSILLGGPISDKRITSTFSNNFISGLESRTPSRSQNNANFLVAHEYVSTDLSNRDFLRSEISGLPKQISPTTAGALPPGPARRDGDWLTNLMDRWRPKIAQTNITQNAHPSTYEYVQGREIITVKQDGSADHKTIQAAIDVLKPGQVVEVLDRGPYTESLRIENVPRDCGILSRCGTRVRPAKPIEFRGGSIGHLVAASEHIRIDGFTFLPLADAVLLKLNTLKNATIANCVFLCGDEVCMSHDGKNTSVKYLNNVFEGHVRLNSRLDQLKESNDFYRNFFLGRKAGHAIHVSDSTTKFAENVIGGQAFSIHSALGDTDVDLTLIKNTMVGGIQVGIGVRRITSINNVTGGIHLSSQMVDRRPEVESVVESRTNVIPEHTDNATNLLSSDDTTKSAKDRFVSIDPMSRDYLRLKKSHGIQAGAFSVGPAPKDGDWFTKLLDRWHDARIATSPPPKIDPALQTDEAVARWILSLGGSVAYDTGDGTPQPTIRDPSKLPKQDFRVRQITLLSTEEMSDVQIWRLAKLTSLHTLRLRGCRITDSGIPALEQIKSLRFIGISANENSAVKITDRGLQSLAKLPGIEKLILHYQDITTGGIRSLGTRSKLTELSLLDCPID